MRVISHLILLVHVPVKYLYIFRSFALIFAADGDLFQHQLYLDTYGLTWFAKERVKKGEINSLVMHPLML